MANVFDIGAPDPPPAKPEPKRRSKHREALSSFELAQGKRRLADMVELAFSTLEEAAISADHSTAIKAAQIILDRAGFGPKSTVDINTTNIDLSELSREELAERAFKIGSVLREQHAKAQRVIGSSSTIDAQSSTVQ